MMHLVERLRYRSHNLLEVCSVGLKLKELPYQENSAKIFANVADQPWSIFLDSGYPYINLGRYDILASRPRITLKTFGNETEITDRDGKLIFSQDNPFKLLKSLLKKKQLRSHSLPFCGGALGYFAYDLARRIEQVPEQAQHDLNMPDMAVGIYDCAYIADHQQQRSWIVGLTDDDCAEQQWELFTANSITDKDNFQVLSSPQSTMDMEDYATKFNKIKRYIVEGDCYQVNLAQRFSVQVSGNPWEAYTQLRRVNPAPYACYFNLPEGAVLSFSPERFLKLNKGLVETKPIKGTRKRSSDSCEDRALAEKLLNSTKDRAENLMIVDLLRNDIGKSCQIGSIAVPNLFELESFATVHHLVSTITGVLRSDQHALDLLQACFPGGSITGAPKLRAMQIIEELEPYRRGVYCGSIAYIGFDGNMDSNIAIRTIVYNQEKMYCWSGGGIVLDSQLNAEYRECFDKISAILDYFLNNNVAY